MFYFRHLLPMISFILLFVGSGIYFTFLGENNAFYQLQPVVAILPAIGAAWLLCTRDKSPLNAFLSGVGHHDILSMCVIFLLAGAFSQVTNDVGSVNATVNLALSLISDKWLLVGVFLVTAFISTAVGTSMGAIATIAPIVASMGAHITCPMPLMAATVVGGAMFGDNLSLVSDTTIASVSSQGADSRSKFLLNAKIALVSGVVTLGLLIMLGGIKGQITVSEYQPMLVLPYFLLIFLALSGINVYISLVISTLSAMVLGLALSDINIINLCKSVHTGFMSMQDIMLLSLMVGGLSGLVGDQFMHQAAKDLSGYARRYGMGKKVVALLIAKMGALFDLLLANNTIAIIVSGQIAKEMANEHNIPAHESAAWLDIGSCIMQGLIPYGAQVLLVSSITGISPLSVAIQVYYCMILGVISVGYILIFTTIDKNI
tara:strand:- start:605 stop:1897 length:1293 start_codon:yes stop_codon:yes gene_type:complete